MVTFPAAEHHRPLTGTKLCCLVNRETLAQGCYLVVHQARVKPATSQSPVQYAIITPPSYYDADGYPSDYQKNRVKLYEEAM